jgi:hypothetical protein
MIDIKNKLDIVDKMIDYVQRKIRSNESLMGMVNSTYEYETFFGYNVNTDELDEMKLNVKALDALLEYRTELLNYGAEVTGHSTEPTLTLPDGFEF